MGTASSEETTTTADTALTDRWTQLRWHDEQQRLRASDARFKVVSAGRRSGKTELAKRDSVIRAMGECEVANARYILAAPTLSQAKAIFWQDLQDLVPQWAKVKTIHTELTIKLVNGAQLLVMGLDRPQRIEGPPIRDIKVDEYANCQADAWDAHIYPALYTEGAPPGTAWLFGVPEGRNHYWKKYKDARAKIDGDWDAFTWFSSDILPQEEIAAARRHLDPLTFKQEYEGSFVTFEGRAYYSFGAENLRPLEYNHRLDLIFCFDFNIKPGVAAVIQEQMVEGTMSTCVIGEVWIPQGSNTPMVCRKLAEKWCDYEGHPGRVKCYGDSTGIGKHSSSERGSNWDIIKEELNRYFTGSVVISGDEYPQVLVDVKSNKPERDRVNAMNSRIMAADDSRHFFVDPVNAPHVADDFEGTRLLPGGNGELDKGKRGDNWMHTHLSDGIGCYVAQKFPLGGGSKMMFEQMY